MKSIIFLDNDNQLQAEEDVDEVHNYLEDVLGVYETIEIKIISDFSRKDKEEVLTSLFSGDSIITTYSMYTATHYNSLYQMLSIFKSAGRNDIKGLVYIDVSGMLLDTLNREIKSDGKMSVTALIKAVHDNIILTRGKDNEYLTPLRICIDFNRSYYEGCFATKEVSKEILQGILTN